MTTHTTTNNVNGILPDDYGQLIIAPVQREALALDPRVSTVVSTNSTEFRLPVLRQDVGAAWLTEGGEIAPADAVFDELIVRPGKVGGLTIISRELSEDSSPAAQVIVGDSLARSIAGKIDAAFFGALASPAPAGLASLTKYNSTGPVDGYSQVLYTTAITNLDPFAEAIAAAEVMGSTVTSFVTTPEVALVLAKLKSATSSNQPLLGIDATNGTARQVLGVPLLVSSYVPANTVYALDASKQVSVLRDDVRLERSSDAYFSSDRVGVKATLRLGFAYPSLRSIVKIEKAA
jgi:HK97 family phage major capsid protein